ncbi:MAG: xanthine dehydrogenase family protein molybdopterin-binding subunit, partial [Alphaproteobacteria bacterium]|nr:xanthine dehydrogenase family protein molybdopterin-binding subunit [Alphaproteobacteria bacterium]
MTGKGIYTADIKPKNHLVGYVFRSPFAHARITDYDLAAARAEEGVFAVFSAQDLDDEGLGDIPCLAAQRIKGDFEINQNNRPILVKEYCRHIGDPIFFIVAKNLNIAKDAAEKIEIEFDELPVVTGVKDKSSQASSPIHKNAKQNKAFLWKNGNKSGVDVAKKSASHSITINLHNNRVIANPIEPRAAIGSYIDGRYILHTPSQGVHNLKKQLSQFIFKEPAENFLVQTGEVGGGFGMKLFMHPEQPLVLFAAKKLGKTVKWVAERSSDSFLSDVQGRDQTSTASLYVDDKGKILALEVNILANQGAYLSNYAPFVATIAGCKMLSGAYKIPNIYVEVEGKYTNTVPIDAYRGAGRPEATYLIERLMDKAARKLDLSPIAFRKLNFIQPTDFPYNTGIGPIYDSGIFSETLDMAMKEIDFDGFEKRQVKSGMEGKYRGLGLCYYIEACGAGAGETATLHLCKDGHVELLIGSQSNGQGHETAYKQLISDKLNISFDKIRVIQGDSDLIKTGAGTGGSRSIPEGGAAVYHVASTLKTKILQAASEEFETSIDDLEINLDAVKILGTDKKFEFIELANLLDERGIPPLQAEERFQGSEFTYPNGAHLCELEVDPETGNVNICDYVVYDDFGKILNPMLLEGQIQGGITQGYGQAICENTIYDEDGQLLSGSLMDYALPRFDHMPSPRLFFHEKAPCLNN